MFFVYLITNEQDDIYIGGTNDLKRRLREHRQGLSSATRSHTWRLAYYETYADEADARGREQKLKHHGYSIRHLKSRLKRSLGKI